MNVSIFEFLILRLRFLMIEFLKCIIAVILNIDQKVKYKPLRRFI